ncbi:MAG: hypothetical protein ACLGJD_25220, partial [Gammaproteobacteria bacterium]
GLVARAKELKASKVALNAKQVLDALLGQGDKVLNRSTAPAERRLGRAGQGAVLAADATGRMTLRFDRGVLTPAREAALIDWLNAQLGAD